MKAEAAQLSRDCLCISSLKFLCRTKNRQGFTLDVYTQHVHDGGWFSHWRSSQVHFCTLTWVGAVAWWEGGHHCHKMSNNNLTSFKFSGSSCCT